MCEYCDRGWFTRAYGSEDGTFARPMIDNEVAGIIGSVRGIDSCLNFLEEGKCSLSVDLLDVYGNTLFRANADINYCPMCGRKLGEVDE